MKYAQYSQQRYYENLERQIEERKLTKPQIAAERLKEISEYNDEEYSEILPVLSRAFGVPMLFKVSQEENIPIRKNALITIFDGNLSYKNLSVIVSGIKETGQESKLIKLLPKTKLKNLITLYQKHEISENEFFKGLSKNGYVSNYFLDKQPQIKSQEKIYADFVANYYLDMEFKPVSQAFDNINRFKALAFIPEVYDLFKNHLDFYKAKKYVYNNVLELDVQNFIDKYEARYVEKLDLILDSISWLMEDSVKKNTDNIDAISDYFSVLSKQIKVAGVNISEQQNRAKQLFEFAKNHNFFDKASNVSYECEVALGLFTGANNNSLDTLRSDIRRLLLQDKMGELGKLLKQGIPNELDFNERMKNNLMYCFSYKFVSEFDLKLFLKLGKFLKLDSIDAGEAYSQYKLPQLVLQASYLNTKISNPTQELVLDLLNIGEEKLIKDSELVSKMNDLLKDGLIDKQKYEEVISINTKKINKNKKMRAI